MTEADVAYVVGGPARLATRRATASDQGMPSRTTSARPRNSGGGRAAPTARHAAATAAQVGASGRYRPPFAALSSAEAASSAVQAVIDLGPRSGRTVRRQDRCEPPLGPGELLEDTGPGLF